MTVEELLNPSAAIVTTFVRWLLLLADVLMWTGFVQLYRCRNCDTGGRVLVLWWTANSGLFLTFYLYVRWYLDISAPAPLLTLWAAVCWLQAGLSIIVYVTTWKRVTRNISRRQSHEHR